MSSPTSPDDLLPDPDRRAAVLEQVRTEGRRRLRRRRAAAAVAGVAAVALLAVGSVAVAGGGDERLDVASDDTDATTSSTRETRRTTSTSSTDTTAVDKGPAGDQPGTTVVDGDTTTTTPPTSTTTTQRPTTTTTTCRNSTEPSCGDFYWDPPPAPNQPVTVTVTVSPSNPRVGDTVTFHVVAEDPDWALLRPMWVDDGEDRHCDVTHEFGDEPTRKRCWVPGCAAPARHGPWTPPDPRPDRHEVTLTHAYRAAGTYRASFPATSYHCDSSPYQSEPEWGVGSVTVTVTE